ncbi:orotidine-5'-phosphate decarboxylase [Nodosilinea sp. LEGE 07298]|uniref:orotidine-5'-phosphate decarboxylase n=1 Tax=Nodosilinea sp. LEGE 07298 TaxID=2777970 RepID=UPI00187DFEB6|nr:orotidine-5'-phosphate decarboxylase [Nodosilinea sp. LEGE 07298]MBE9111019.1 orotidine-5'-phosphate decarboxylase [Nodosilinea sp. LEGE 07298]
MTVDQRIIVPLDVPSAAAALALVEALPQVSFWKVGLELFVSAGPELIEALKARQKRVFLDLKFHDIPNTMAGACAAAGRYGADLLTVHTAAGKEALVAAQTAAIAGAEAAGVDPPVVLGVTLLTSIAPNVLAEELKVPLESTSYVLQMARLAQDSGLQGAVCSPQEASQLRRFLPSDFALVCPGVRPTWASSQDQRRTLTPLQALQAGATYLVIGRPITAAPDPAAAFGRICEECSAAIVP